MHLLISRASHAENRRHLHSFIIHPTIPKVETSGGSGSCGKVGWKRAGNSGSSCGHKTPETGIKPEQAQFLPPQIPPLTCQPCPGPGALLPCCRFSAAMPEALTKLHRRSSEERARDAGNKVPIQMDPSPAPRPPSCFA